MPDGRKQYRVAIVGTGAIAGGRHIPAVQAQDGRAKVVAVVDVDGDRAAAFADEWGVEHSYTDLDTMLAADRPDLVIICPPPSVHHDGVQACLRAGAWVWCEKPPVLSLAEYDDLMTDERDGGPYVGYVFQHRFGSAARTLREHIAAGALGRPLVGICHTLWYRDDAYYEVPWRGKWETEGGGPTMGHGIHQMDLMLSLLGDWREVRAMMGTLDRRIATEDVSLAAVSFESGALVSVVNSALSPRSGQPGGSPPPTCAAPTTCSSPSSSTRWTAPSGQPSAARTGGAAWSSSQACTSRRSPAARSTGPSWSRATPSTRSSTAVGATRQASRRGLLDERADHHARARHADRRRGRRGRDRELRLRPWCGCLRGAQALHAPDAHAVRRDRLGLPPARPPLAQGPPDALVARVGAPLLGRQHLRARARLREIGR